MSIRRRALFLAGLLAAVSCSDAGNPIAPETGGNPPRPPTPNDALQSLDCSLNVSGGTLECRPSAASAGSASGLILGNQGVYVRLGSSNVRNIAPDTLAFDATVQNLIPQALGVDSTGAVDAEGVRAFFYQEPYASVGTGTVDVGNPDGNEIYLTEDRPYYQYAGGLDSGEVSLPKTWKLRYDPGVQRIAFKMYIAADVRYPEGFLRLSPDTTLLNVGQRDTLTADVRTVVGARDSVSRSVTFTSSNPSVVTVSALSDTTAEIAAVTQGTAWVRAVNDGNTRRVDSTLVIVDNAPVVTPDSAGALSNVTTPVDSAHGMLANDSDDGNLDVVEDSITTAKGGLAVLRADGSYTYLSASGFAGRDTISYFVTDGVRTLPALAVVDVDDSNYWYVRAGGAGDGRDSRPFGSVADAQVAAEAGDTIFVLAAGATDLNGAWLLEDNQAIIGQGIPAPITRGPYNESTLTVFTAGGAPGLSREDAGATVTLAQNNTIAGVGITAADGAAITGSGFGTLTVGQLSLNPRGPALNLTDGTVAGTIDLLSSTNSKTTGVSLTNVGGTIAPTGGSISGAEGTAFAVSGGGGTITYPGSIGNALGLAVGISGRSGGAVTLSGAITDAGDGISVTGTSGGAVELSGTLALTGKGITASGNTGGEVSFTGTTKNISTGATAAVTAASNTGATVTFGGGGLAISTTSGAGFSATGAGTVQVTGPNNTIASTTGTALTLNGVGTGTSGISFRSVSSNGAVNGIAAANLTGNGFQVTGDGSTAGSGGTIQGATGAGVSITGVPQATLEFMNVASPAGHAISLSSTTATTLNGVAVTGAGNGGNAGIFGSSFGTLTSAGTSVSATGGPALSLLTGTVNGGFSSLSSATSASSGVILNAIAGTFTVAGGSITNAASTGFAVIAGSVSPTIQGSLSQTASNAALVAVSGGHTGTLTFNTGTLQASTGTGIQFNNADGAYAFDGTTTLNGGDAGVDVTGGSGGAISFGTGASITNPTGTALDVANGGSAANVTYAGTISANAGRPVSVAGVSGGAVTVSGNITASGLGLSVSGNSGGTITFSGGSKSIGTATPAVTLATNPGATIVFSGGGLAISTPNNATVLSATAGGTLSITGPGNTAASMNGTPVVLANVSTGTEGVSFASVSTTGGANGISLTNVTGAGFQTVGGSLQNTTGPTVLISGGSATAVNVGATLFQAANAATVSVSGGHSGGLTVSGAVTATHGSGLQFNNADGTYAFTGATTLSNGVAGADAGIDVTNNSSGTFSFNADASITNPVNALVNISNSAPTFSYAGSFTKNNNAVAGILVQDNTGGTIAFTGDAGETKVLSTSTANAVNLVNNTGATIQFGGGGLVVTTTTGNGFNATGGGTVQVTGSNNTLAATGGIALNVSATTIGASGLTFRSISANGGSNGIVLSGTGTSNGLQVTGFGGAAGSGGTIQNTTGSDGASAGNGVYLNGARNVNLNWMAFSGHQNHGLFGTGVRGMNLNHVRFTGTHGTSNSGTFSEGPVRLVDAGGGITVKNSRLDGAAMNGFRLENTSGTAPVVDSLVLANDTVSTMQGSTSDVRGSGLQAIIGDGSANVRIRDNAVTYWWGNGIQVGVQTGAGASTALIQNNRVQQTSGALAAAGGIEVNGGNLSFNISNNQISGTDGTAVSADKNQGNTYFNGTISGNTIGTSGVANSGSATGTGIFVQHAGPNATTVRISNNVIRQINGSQAIWTLLGDDVGGGGSGTMNATITGNNIAEEGTASSARSGIVVQSGRVTGDTDVMCADVGGAGALGNSITNFNNRIRPNERFLTTMRLVGYTGGNSDNTAINAYLVARNPGTVAVTSNNVSAGGPGILNTVPAGSACPQPSL
ncbi:beta strand repeat-containing protein [Longimicrobium terrae]|uniref:BIG2 domain-containing protein n=1 Tax=Longimicrobium terrae TaxID=1639882 RepID=A0A841GU63_9BACT|nr:Ig-like domain-containing protein [Longimicrobium terrae]MBB4634667.1 hypothetical protein [Longimicrobium terrae]MBB6068443.1 hypothetical protein [Longimicrobium terrae]NNC32725.1 hypothetical protein [Longimicrobium terrae]